MAKLSEAGKIYMDDYLALKYAEKEMNQFLQHIFTETAVYIKERSYNGVSSPIEWVMDFKDKKEKLAKGDLFPEFEWQGTRYGKAENKLSVRYWDIRSYKNMDSAGQIRISIRCLRELKNRFMNSSKKKLDQGIKAAGRKGITITFQEDEPLYKQFISVDGDDGDGTAKRAADEMIRAQSGLQAFLEVVIAPEEIDPIEQKRNAFIALIESYPSCKVEVYNEKNESYNLISQTGLTWKQRSHIFGKVHRGKHQLRIDIDYPSGMFSMEELKEAVPLPLKEQVSNSNESSYMRPDVNASKHDVLRLFIQVNDFQDVTFDTPAFQALIDRIISETVL